MTDNITRLSAIQSMKYSLTSCKSFANGNGDHDEDDYVLHCALNCTSTRLAVNVSNSGQNPVKILDSETLTDVSFVKDLSSENINPRLKFSSENGHHLLVSSSDAIRLYDIRHTTAKASKQWNIKVNNDHTDPKDLNFITCFDFNCDFRYLIAGTEQCPDQNVYLHFWDIRNSNNILGSYYETHTNDITTIEFHPNLRNIVATGACDELINIFDINQPDEDEALITTLNVESAIEKVKWMRSKGDNKSSNLIVMTQDENAQFWDYDNVKPHFVLNSDHKYSSDFSFDYVVDVINYDDTLCVGDKNGALTLINVDNFDADYDMNIKTFLSKGHTKLVRTITSSNDGSVIFSGGEDGAVCSWRWDQSNIDNGNKRKTKLKRSEKHRIKPY